VRSISPTVSAGFDKVEKRFVFQSREKCARGAKRAMHLAESLVFHTQATLASRKTQTDAGQKWSKLFRVQDYNV
jgi:hypothetical protein